VTIPETDTSEAASSDIYFTILPRPAFLSISKTNNLAEESATVTVTMANGLSDVVGEFITLTVEYENPYYATDQGENGSSESPESTSDQDENEPSLTTQDMMNESGEVLIQSVKAPIVKNADGTLTATYKFSHVKAGEYKVTARFEDPNYSVQPVSAQYSKDLRYYIVDAKDKTVTFGDEPFELQVEVSDSSGDEVESPSLSYSVVPADNIPEGLPAVFDDNVVRLSDGECGTVIVESAGLAAIRVEALDDDTHKGGFDYALVTVERAPLCLTVKAFSKVADGKPATVTYSTIDKIDAKYPSNYTGEVSLTYFEKRSNTWIKLDKPPIAVGTYAVVATAREDGNYEGDIAEAEFRIMSPSGPVGPVDPDGPDNPDNPDDPDNPSDEPGGSDNPDSSKDSDDSSNPANPSSQPTSGSGSSSASSPSTGDLLIVWPLVGLAAISLIVLVIAYRRIRE
jgi:hypothetical protein